MSLFCHVLYNHNHIESILVPSSNFSWQSIRASSILSINWPSISVEQVQILSSRIQQAVLFSFVVIYLIESILVLYLPPPFRTHNGCSVGKDSINIRSISSSISFLQSSMLTQVCFVVIVPRQALSIVLLLLRSN